MSDYKRAVITGIGIVSPIGIGCKEHWKSLKVNGSGIKDLISKRQEYFPFKYGAFIENFEIKNYFNNFRIIRNLNYANQYAMLAADLALKDSKEYHHIPPERRGIFLLTGMGQIDENDLEQTVAYCDKNSTFSYKLFGERGIKLMNPLLPIKFVPNTGLAAISIQFGFMGPNIVASPFESETVALVEEAVMSIINDEADICLVGGADAPFCVSIMGNLATLRKEKLLGDNVNNIDDRLILGEGAAFLVLEDAEKAIAQGKKVYGYIDETCFVSLGDDIENENAMKNSYEYVVGKCMKNNDIDVAILTDNGMGVTKQVEDGFWTDKTNKYGEKIDIVSLEQYTGYLPCASLLLNICQACLMIRNRSLPTCNEKRNDRLEAVLVCGSSISNGLSAITVKRFGSA